MQSRSDMFLRSNVCSSVCMCVAHLPSPLLLLHLSPVPESEAKQGTFPVTTDERHVPECITTPSLVTCTSPVTKHHQLLHAHNHMCVGFQPGLTRAGITSQNVWQRLGSWIVHNARQMISYRTPSLTCAHGKRTIGFPTTYVGNIEIICG